MNSAPEWQNLHAGGRIIAAGVAEAIGPLTAEQRHILDRMPVIIDDNPTENGMKAHGFFAIKILTV
jgi:hypothetical protein